MIRCSRPRPHTTDRKAPADEDRDSFANSFGYLTQHGFELCLVCSSIPSYLCRAKDPAFCGRPSRTFPAGLLQRFPFYRQEAGKFLKPSPFER